MDAINLTRAERRALKKKSKQVNYSVDAIKKPPFTIKTIHPKTENQEKVFRAFDAGKNLVIHGYSGVGKSFISLYLALNEIEQYKQYSKVVIIRSVVPSRDMGFLPGSIKEKSAIYEAPYISICADLYGRGDAYQVLTNKGVIEFQTTSFLRGMTLEDSIVILDEAQSCNFHEIDTVISRLGDNSRLIVCGDIRQDDLKVVSKQRNDISGIVTLMKIARNMKSIELHEFTEADIIRSGFVREYIIAREKTNIH